MEKTKGFTLLELLICLSIMAIIGFFSLSSWRCFQESNEIRIRESSIKEAILYAKQQSFILKKKLVLAGLHNGDWSTGLILFIDKGDHHYVSSEQLIRQWQWSSTLVHVHWKGFYSKEYLLFAPDFRQSALNGQFEISGEEGGSVILVVNRLGRVRV